ncbi:ABC transporter ATP-binding protein [Vagococcus elongatus]|uniref:ABC transporter ATP-binding protein n=1 Tax=Vagococcus elongatus TaxID=180344 RepID=A0A430AZN0_9ENTE|nr:ATP-binding cassette domain-containing protein [Vagococcus elongatus]RSU13519.1 ABC transporter ATP-binding protein [Vagococcus elongatus]
MTETVLELVNATKTIKGEFEATRNILDHVNLKVKKGDFVVVLGGNGAGKSTLFNSISGSLMLTEGHVKLNNQEVSQQKEEERAKYIGRVFQDPKMGTAPRMTVSENLLLATLRGKKRLFKNRQLAQHKEKFYQLTSQIGNGLEKHLDVPTGQLSGGQRQALSLIMATITIPDLLLLDEHTAALDPKTARSLMALTDERIREKNLTCLMITHRLEDAITYGNRLILLKDGKIHREFSQKEKEQLTVGFLAEMFEE